MARLRSALQKSRRRIGAFVSSTTTSTRYENRSRAAGCRAVRRAERLDAAAGSFVLRPDAIGHTECRRNKDYPFDKNWMMGGAISIARRSATLPLSANLTASARLMILASLRCLRQAIRTAVARATSAFRHHLFGPDAVHRHDTTRRRNGLVAGAAWIIDDLEKDEMVNQIHCGDAATSWPVCRTGCIDLIVTSPGYWQSEQWGFL